MRDKNKSYKKILSEILITGFIILAASLFVRLVVKAGSLTPSASPASTMSTLTEIYNPLAGTYDSSGVTASSSGNFLEMARCLVTKMDGGNCQ